MKKKSLIVVKGSNTNPFRSILTFVIVASISCVAASFAIASVELDRQYALETIGFLRATDNVDGLFADYVDSAYKDYFSKQSRFVVQDLSKADTVLSHSKLPYWKVIQDNDVLSQVARATRSQTIIRTKVIKEGPQYRFELEWLHAPKMDPLTTDSMVLHEPRDGTSFGIGDVQAQIEAVLDRMIKKVPWRGHVTGRDNRQITFNIGASSNLHKGDTLIISTLDDVKLHPLLHTIVDWKLTKTGSVELDSVDDSIGFGHVVDEDTERPVGRYQKVTEIIPVADDSRFKVITEKNQNAQALSEPPKLGYLRASLWPGGLSRQYSAATDSQSRAGGGLFIGAKLDGQLWFTHEFFSEMEVAYGTSSYSQSLPGAGQPTTLNGSASATEFKLDGGYSYLVTGDFLGPKALLRLGYMSTSYSFPSSTADKTGPISFKSLFLGLGGDLPIRNEYGVDLDFDIGLLNSATETGSFLDGSLNGASVVSFSLGGYYRLNNRMTIRAAIEIMAQSADFSDGANVSQKVITFSPSLIYYF
jgi:hypothetical protein